MTSNHMFQHCLCMSLLGPPSALMSSTGSPQSQQFKCAMTVAAILSAYLLWDNPDNPNATAKAGAAAAGDDPSKGGLTADAPQETGPFGKSKEPEIRPDPPLLTALIMIQLFARHRHIHPYWLTWFAGIKVWPLLLAWDHVWEC